MKIVKKEVLRYLGYRGQKIDDSLAGLLDECVSEVRTVSNLGFTYEIYDIEGNEEGLCLKGTTLILRGRDIHSNLAKAEKCAVMAVTLGLEVDRRIDFYTRADLTKGLIFDACATAAVESCCDIVQEEIKARAKIMGLETTSRFSPGYGDFYIGIQKEIVRALKTYEKIGLSVNESSIMIPRKSVTAIIGMQNEGCDTVECKCGSCEDKYCSYRRDRDYE